MTQSIITKLAKILVRLLISITIRRDITQQFWQSSHQKSRLDSFLAPSSPYLIFDFFLESLNKTYKALIVKVMRLIL